MRADRWEIGSDFHWPGLPRPGRVPVRPWSTGLLLSSGRDALRVALATGVRERGWRRLWVPEYFCQRVVRALVRPDLELRTYPDDPLRLSPDPPDTRRGDAILLMNYFGLRHRVALDRRDGVDIIEDHSHDPTSAWAAASDADFCVASLRKTIPLPDGGVIWSPRGHRLQDPPPATAQRQEVATARLAAMILKALYLEGHDIDSAAFRHLVARSERGLAVPAVSAMSDLAVAILATFPVDAWRDARRANHAAFRASIEDVGWCRVLAAPEAGAPLSCILVVDSRKTCEAAREHLIGSRIYPAVLWPLERPVLAVGERTRDLSRRLLSLACDARYGVDDMYRVGDVLHRLPRRGAGGRPNTVATQPSVRAPRASPLGHAG